jgi:hypothetical protein
MSGGRVGYNNAKMAQVVDDEGLSYAIMDYMGADMIADPELRKLWAEAKVLLLKIDVILDKARGGDTGD